MQSYGNLKDEDRIFTNLYGRHDWKLKGALSRVSIPVYLLYFRGISFDIIIHTFVIVVPFQLSVSDLTKTIIMHTYTHTRTAV